jgi:hypothetical protein
MTITVHQRPLENTRSSGKSCKWVAEAIVNGRTYTATSRMAPANDIARQLVTDGVPDAPMHVYTEGLKGCLVWRSFYKAAGFTYEETVTKPVHMVRWRDPAAEAAQIAARKAPKQGVKASPATPAYPEAAERQNAPFSIGPKSMCSARPSRAHHLLHILGSIIMIRVW